MSTRYQFSRVVSGFVLLLAMCSTKPSSAQSNAGRVLTRPNPWGVSSSASAFRNHAEWFPKLAAAGVTTVRLFPEWRGIEPKPDQWNWEQADALVKAAAENNIEINGILMGSPPGTKAVHAFPMDDLEGWKHYVSTVVKRYQKHIHYWEVWNEGNGGFNDGHHTTTDYAQLAIATYEAAKQADPKAQVGLTVASFDAPYLNKTILAMKAAGKPNSFDYLCIHPYEIADGLNAVDGEIPYLWMTHLLREMLKASAPERANAEIWITEIGRRLDNRNGHVVSEVDAAAALAKIYTMAIAQGIARIQWFEAQDPQGEDQGFGLLNREGETRASYRTLQSLAGLLGPSPKYLGWLALGKNERGYGFVFEGSSGPVLIAWMPDGMTDDSLKFTLDVEVIDSRTVQTIRLKEGQPLELTETPVFISGLPSDLAQKAKANSGKKFPWGGDYSQARTVSTLLDSPGAPAGIVPLNLSDRPQVIFKDGSEGTLVEGDINHPIRFYVHPTFASFQTKEYYVRATVRRVAGGNVGMNLFYEVADSQGKSPYTNTGTWFGCTPDHAWQTYTWHIKDACFSKMWGADFFLRPELSVPFAIGKVEVSTEPFGK